jgi:hypothetical protein
MAQSRQQGVQGSAEADTGTDAQQRLGTGIEINERAIRINDQDGRRQAAEDIAC